MAIRSLLLAVLVSACAGASPAVQDGGAFPPAREMEEMQRAEDCTLADETTLEGRNCAFLRAVRENGDRAGRERVAAFLPRTGHLTYLTTIHDDPPILSHRRFPAGDWEPVLEEPLRMVFDTDQHVQPVGTLSHQLIFRGTVWRRVDESTRFVPGDAPDDSALFVEWRREGDVWVVSIVGDEQFRRGPLPAWCC